jgi:hypothetical protein
MLTIVGEDSNYYLIECSVCSKDTELYPEIRQLKSSFRQGKIPCGCAKIPKYSEKQWSILLNRALISRGGKYSLLSTEGKLNSKCKITLINNDTGNIRDSSLFDFIRYESRDGKLDKGSKISSVKRTEYSTVLSRIQPILEEYGKTLISLSHEKKWILKYNCSECGKLHNEGNFSIDICRLEAKGFNCQCHSKSFRRNAEDVLTEVTFALQDKGFFLSFVPEYTDYNTSKAQWVCNNGHTNIQALCNMRSSDYSCPRCVKHGYNPNKSAYLYLVSFDEGCQMYLKYGITNRQSPDDRLKQIFKKKSYEKLLTVSSDGDTILKLENKIKSTFESNVKGLNITSGFTEVVNFNFRDDIINLIYNFTIGDI